MKFINKLFAFILATVLVFTLSACGNDKDNKPDDNSKPTVSTPSEDKTTTESKPEESKPEESKPEESQPESKPEPKPEPKPQPVKKTPAELVIGKWTTTSDIAPILAEEGIEIDGPLEVTITTEFTTSGTLIEKADKEQINSAVIIATKKAMLDEIAANGMTQADFEAQIGMTVDEYVEQIYAELDLDFGNLFSYIAEYKFEGDILLVKTEDTDFVETQYTFINDNTLKITTDGDEIIYTRIK